MATDTPTPAKKPARAQHADPLPSGQIQHSGAVRVTGKNIDNFKLLSGETPQQHYPPAARAAGLAGKVVVDLLLNDMGQVLESQVLSEVPTGHGFGLAALDASKTFVYANPLQKLVLMSVTIEFTL